MSEIITKAEVRHVAELARLELSDVEEARMTEQMNSILSYMDKLNELDTTDIQPTSHAIHVANVFREDRVSPSIPREEALQNAPRSDGVLFIVPRII